MFLSNLFPFKNPHKADLSQNELCELHNSYLNFVKDILAYSYPPTVQNPDLLRLNAINKILRILALDEQHYILQFPIKGISSFTYFPLFYRNSFKCPKCGHLDNCKPVTTETNNSVSFNIAHHPAIAQPWERDRLIRSLSTIGSSVKNPFVSDETNHWGSTLYPLFNLLLIRNGFHSSTSGILDTTAVFYPEKFCDCSSLYGEIFFDGISFRHIKCGQIIDTPENKSIGTIYEIGRLILESNLSFLDLLKYEGAFSPALIRDK